VQAIVRDVAAVAQELGERQELITKLLDLDKRALGDAYREELQPIQEEFERKKGQIFEYARELDNLGVQLKDPHTGLVDFPAWMDGHEVLLCWRLGEEKVSYWHEIEAGFAGRKQLTRETQTS
jgi:hypothetical protein